MKTVFKLAIFSALLSAIPNMAHAAESSEYILFFSRVHAKAEKRAVEIQIEGEPAILRHGYVQYPVTFNRVGAIRFATLEDVYRHATASYCKKIWAETTP